MKRTGALVSWCLLAVLAGRASDDVPYERILASDAEPANWLTYSGNYYGHRYTPLADITRQNVEHLRPVWVYQMREAGKVETSPIVVDGVVYVTESPTVVTALDARSGRPLWTFRTEPSGSRGCCGLINRGVAVLDDAIFFTTFDAHLVALDRETGTLRWSKAIADAELGYSATGAPLAIRDKIIVGVAGGDYGIRGFLDAYDPRTGNRAWRFWTVPGPGEPGHDSWNGDSWKTGGAPTWVTGSYDPALDLLFWGVGNPGPDWNGDTRTGDNLYSNSLVAIDAATGRLRWYFQFTPHDVHDFDANQVPILVDRPINGVQRKLVVTANRNGFYYVLDRETGAFLSATPFVKQDWALGIDERGRPVPRPGAEPSEQGTLVFPGGGGGTNWMSPSFSPVTGLVYVPALGDYAETYYKMTGNYRPGRRFEGGATTTVPGAEPAGAVKALDATTGHLRWQFALQTGSYAGLLATAGGLVFGGSADGNFFALDAQDGTPLWHFQTGAEIAANPVSFRVDRGQQVAIAAGTALFSFAVE